MSTEDAADQVRCTELLLEETPDAAIVSNLGVASYVLAGVEDRERNFYLWGSMGVTTPVGLGLALSVDDPVVVLDGDGSMLMSLGSLVTVSKHDPENLVIVIWDNGQYGTTGGQTTHSDIIEFAAVGEDVGLRTFAADTAEAFEQAYADAVRHDGAALVVCQVEGLDPDARPPLDFAHIKRRFRGAMTDEDTRFS